MKFLDFQSIFAIFSAIFGRGTNVFYFFARWRKSSDRLHVVVMVTTRFRYSAVLLISCRLLLSVYLLYHMHPDVDFV